MTREKLSTVGLFLFSSHLPLECFLVNIWTFPTFPSNVTFVNLKVLQVLLEVNCLTAKQESEERKGQKVTQWRPQLALSRPKSQTYLRTSQCLCFHQDESVVRS